MKTAIWLAWRELWARKLGFAVAVAMIAAAVALSAAAELISRAREAAVAAELDNIGPAMHLVPAGRTGQDLARFELGSSPIGADAVTQVRRELSAWIRAVDGRLLSRQSVDGRSTPIVGVDPSRVVSSSDALRGLDAGEAALGAELAERLQRREGDVVRLGETDFRVVAVLEPVGNADDLALFVPLGQLQELTGRTGAVNEVRLFPRAGATLEPVERYLASNHPDLSVIRTERGNDSEQAVDESLRLHRWVIYLITGLIVAVCVFIWSYLNALERRTEMATLTAIGGGAGTLIVLLAVRSGIVAAVGAAVGYLAGAVIALVQDYESASGVVWSLSLVSSLVGATVALSIVGALPASIVSAFRKHVRVLQS